MRQNIVVIADKAHGNQYRFGGEVNEKTIEILHGFHFLKDEGVMAIILPHGGASVAVPRNAPAPSCPRTARR